MEIQIVWLICVYAHLIQTLQRIQHQMTIWTVLAIAVNGIKNKKTKKKNKTEKGGTMIDKILRVNERHVVVYFVDQSPIIILGENALDRALLLAKRGSAWRSHLKVS